MENNKKKKHIALNCAIGALALLGSAGTITFGTLWCQSRNNGGDTPTGDTLTINLDTPDSEGQNCVLQTTNIEIKKNQRIELVSKMSDVVVDDKTKGLNEYYLDIRENDLSYFPTFYNNCEFYIDDTLITPDLYIFSTIAVEDANLHLWNPSELPVTIDYDTSLFRVILTPYNDIEKSVIFTSYFFFNAE